MDTLIDQFELKETSRFGGVVNADDVVGILRLRGTFQRGRVRCRLWDFTLRRYVLK
jgi:hypothetical protein